MSREQDRLGVFTEFADTLVADYDVVEFLQPARGTNASRLLDVSEAGIMLADRDGTFGYTASSSERMRLIELFELQHDEGPCLDAYRTGAAGAEAPTDRRPRDERWPSFVARAHDVGFSVDAALPPCGFVPT